MNYKELSALLSQKPHEIRLEPISTQLTLLPLGFPKFPSLNELVDQEEPQASLPKRDLLKELLHGQIEPIYYDASERPDEYPDGTLVIIETVLRGTDRDKLPKDAQDVLDAAILEFASGTKKKAPPAKEVPLVRVSHLEGEEAPESELTPFWWL